MELVGLGVLRPAAAWWIEFGPVEGSVYDGLQEVPIVKEATFTLLCQQMCARICGLTCRRRGFAVSKSLLAAVHARRVVARRR